MKKSGKLTIVWGNKALEARAFALVALKKPNRPVNQTLDVQISFLTLILKFKTIYLLILWWKHSVYILILTRGKNALRTFTLISTLKPILRFKHNHTVASKNDHSDVVSISRFGEPVMRKNNNGFPRPENASFEEPLSGLKICIGLWFQIYFNASLVNKLDVSGSIIINVVGQEI